MIGKGAAHDFILNPQYNPSHLSVKWKIILAPDLAQRDLINVQRAAPVLLLGNSVFYAIGHLFLRASGGPTRPSKKQGQTPKHFPTTSKSLILVKL